MNHSFTPSAIDATRCNICKMSEIAHSDKATCDCCPNIGPVDVVYGNMLMCKACQIREAEAERIRMSPENQQKRVDEANADLSNRVKLARELDNSIEVKTDLFNAATRSIVELKAAIDIDESIQNKPYALAEELTNRFNHFKQVIFDRKREILEAENTQKAIQVYLNNFSNQLRAEEREKLKISDINYNPGPTKVQKPKVIKTSGSKKLDMKELQKYAMELTKELGRPVPEFMLRTIVVSKGITVEAAANILRKSIKESLSEVQ